MKGLLSKKAIRSLVEPLKITDSVFNEDQAHIVFENEDDKIYFSVVDEKRMVYAMYEMDASEMIGEYEVGKKEVGVWDVKQFVNILGKYENDIYTDLVEIKTNEGDNKFIIECGDEKTEIYTSALNLFDDYRCKNRKLKTSALTNAASFELADADLKKLMTNINVFDTQDIITLKGNQGDDFVTVRLSASASTVLNKNESKISGVEVNDDFEMRFRKNKIKGLLSRSNKFLVDVYTGKKEIINVTCERDDYNMSFYFPPLTDQD